MLPFVHMSVKMKSEAVIENELMHRIALRDEKALESLYDRYSKLLYNVILLIIKNQDDAIDLLQELFLHVWKKADGFDAIKGNCLGWLVTIARNLTIDRLRSKSFKYRKQELISFDFDFLHAEMGANQLDALISDENAKLVQEALLQIPSEQKEVIMLAYFDGYSQSEIADKLKIPLGTVKTRTRHGMQRLQQLIVDRIGK